MPHKVYVDPITNDGSRFHLNMPVSKLTKRVTQVIEANVVSLAPPVVETTDRVTHEIRPTPTEPNEARGFGGSGARAARP